MTTTRSQGQAIAALMSELRPDWDYPGCLAAVGAVKHKHAADVAMAAVRLCCTAEAQTPGALKAEQGQHWREKVAPTTHRHPPRREQECRRHPGEWHDACRPCAAERIARADEEPNEPTTPAEQAIAAMKAQLASFRANTCLHGTPVTRCAECARAQETTPPDAPTDHAETEES